MPSSRRPQINTLIVAANQIARIKLYIPEYDAIENAQIDAVFNEPGHEICIFYEISVMVSIDE